MADDKRSVKEKEKPKDSHGKEEKKGAPEKRLNIIRVMETNLDGNRKVRNSIRKIKGVSFMFSNAICNNIEFAEKKLGELSDQEIQQLEDIMTNPGKYSIPTWMYNRRIDPVTGETKHLTVSTLDFIQKMDINEMKKKRSYKGVRHGEHLPVRGQRTRGSFRKGKQVGVSKKKAGK